MLSSHQLERLLQLYPALDSLDNKLLEKAFQRANVVSLPPGKIVFTENQACSAFPFVLDGVIRVYKASETGRELPLYSVEPGDACVVSSGCLLSHKSYNARGVVLLHCDIVMLPDADFEILMSEAMFRKYIFGLFGDRLYRLMELVDEVAFRKLDQRLAKFLLSGDVTIRNSHQQLADELGSVREIISRIMRGFAESGYISQSREEITILDTDGLSKVITG